MADAGFAEFHNNRVRAGAFATAGATYLLIKGIGNCIQTYLQECSKRMVIVKSDGNVIEIRGNFTPTQIAELIDIANSIEIQDEHI